MRTSEKREDGAVRRGSIPLNTGEKRKKRPTNAMKSCPDELDLCPSITCSFKYGVRTKQVIPEGTWMGPYQGTIVMPGEVTAAMDTSYMWEIYENGKLLHYIDGSDENTSSWMRFICCARHKDEQNLFAFQYNKEIYYRAFAPITVGEELLVWYEDSYPQYMGIPLNITDIGKHVDRNANCPVHSSSLTRAISSKNSTDWRNHEEARVFSNPKNTKGFNSAVFAPSTRQTQYRVPNCFSSEEYHVAHLRRDSKISSRDKYGQMAPVRRAIVIQNADNAPDPFCILAREK